MALIEQSILDSIGVKQTLLESPAVLELIRQAAQEAIDAFRSGKKILLCGNGGSAADAQHLAGEFVSRFRFDRPALPAVALNCNASILTAIGNDYEYDMIFERQVAALGTPGDILWGFSSTGHSKNISRALAEAKRRGMRTVAFLGGEGGICREHADLALLIPSGDTPRVQEAHIMVGHILCDCIEQALFSPESGSAGCCR